ncbi:MAG: type II toxin-antitoxin system Phd/YefM family antitoxin [Chloroflexota bacterium]
MSKQGNESPGENEMPIHAFRARTAEVLKAVRETGATYVITNRGEPVAEVVPYGTAVRRQGPRLLGALAGDCGSFYANLPLAEEAAFTKKIAWMQEEELDAELARLRAAYDPAPRG